MLLRNFSLLIRKGTLTRAGRIFTVMAALTLPTSGYANPFEAGLNAMEREHYATAFRAWKDLAEDGEARPVTVPNILIDVLTLPSYPGAYEVSFVIFWKVLISLNFLISSQSKWFLITFLFVVK